MLSLPQEQADQSGHAKGHRRTRSAADSAFFGSLNSASALRSSGAREGPRNSDDGAGSSGSEMAVRSRRHVLSTLSAREREAPGGRETDAQRRRSHEHQPPSRMTVAGSRDGAHEGSGASRPGGGAALVSDGFASSGGRAAGLGLSAAGVRTAGMDSGAPCMSRAGTAPVGGAHSLERKKGPVAAPHLRPDRRRTMSWDGSNDPLAAGRLDPSVLAGAVVYDRAAFPVAGAGPHPGREPRPSSSGAGSLAARRQRRLSPLQASGQLTGPLVNPEAVASPQLPPRAGGGTSGAGGVRVSAREGAGGGLWSPQEQASGGHGRGGSGGAAAGAAGAAEMLAGAGIPRGSSITASSPRHRLSRGSSGGSSTGAALPPLSPQVQQVMQQEHGHAGQQQGSQVPPPRAMTTVDGMVEAMDRGTAEQRVEAVVQLRAAVKESCENRQRLLEREDGVPILLDFLDEAVAALGGGGGRAAGREGRGRGVMDPALLVDCAVAVVLQLCQSRDGAAEFIDVGGVPSLVDVLSHTGPAGTAGAGAGAGASAGGTSGISSMVKGNAAAALFALSSWDDVMDESANASRNGNGAGPSRNIHKTKIQAAGAIPSLVRLLTNETARCRKDAGLALFSLSQDLSCANEIVREGAVSILVDLLGDKRPGVEEKAMAVLANLARRALESESERAREEALWTLHHLVTTGVVAPAVLLKDGALFPIAKLACKKGALAEAKELHRILMTARKGGSDSLTQSNSQRNLSKARRQKGGEAESSSPGGAQAAEAHPGAGAEPASWDGRREREPLEAAQRSPQALQQSLASPAQLSPKPMGAGVQQGEVQGGAREEQQQRQQQQFAQRPQAQPSPPPQQQAPFSQPLMQAPHWTGGGFAASATGRRSGERGRAQEGMGGAGPGGTSPMGGVNVSALVGGAMIGAVGGATPPRDARVPAAGAGGAQAKAQQDDGMGRGAYPASRDYYPSQGVPTPHGTASGAASEPWRQASEAGSAVRPWEVLGGMKEEEWAAFKGWVESTWRCRRCGSPRDDFTDHPVAMALLQRCGISPPSSAGQPASSPLHSDGSGRFSAPSWQRQQGVGGGGGGDVQRGAVDARSHGGGSPLNPSSKRHSFDASPLASTTTTSTFTAGLGPDACPHLRGSSGDGEGSGENSGRLAPGGDYKGQGNRNFDESALQEVRARLEMGGVGGGGGGGGGRGGGGLARTMSNTEVLQRKLLAAITRAHQVYFIDKEPNGSLVFDYLLSALLEVTESMFGFISSALLKADGTPYLKVCVLACRASRSGWVVCVCWAGVGCACLACMLSALLEVTESMFGFISSALLKADGSPNLKTHAMTNVAWSKELRAWYAANSHKGLVFTNLNTLHGTVVLTGQQVGEKGQQVHVVLTNDARNDPRSRGVPPGHPPIDKFMGIPLYTGTELIGVFAVANRAAGYDEQLVKEIEPLTMTIAQMIYAVNERKRRKEAELHLSSVVQLVKEIEPLTMTIAQMIYAVNERKRRKEAELHLSSVVQLSLTLHCLPLSVPALHSAPVAKEGIMSLAHSGHVTSMNLSARQMFGFAQPGDAPLPGSMREGVAAPANLQLKDLLVEIDGHRDMLTAGGMCWWVGLGSHLRAVCAAKFTHGGEGRGVAAPANLQLKDLLVEIDGHRDMLTAGGVSLLCWGGVEWEVAAGIHSLWGRVGLTVGVGGECLGDCRGLDHASGQVHKGTGFRTDGSTFPLEISLSKGNYDTVFYVAVLRDISERLEAEKKLKVRARLRQGEGVVREHTVSLSKGNYDTVFYVAVLRDISERLEAEKKLKESEERWLYALSGSDDGVWDWNVRDNTMFFSDRWKQMLGYEPGDIGSTLDDWERLLHPEDKDRAYADLKEHLDGVTAQFVNEQRLRCKDGSWRWFLHRGKLLSKTDDGEPLRFQRDRVLTIRDSGDMLLQIINDILDYSKIESGKLDMEQTLFNVVQAVVVERVAELLIHNAESKGLDIVIEIEPETPVFLVGDAGRTLQVLINLVDTGIGIPKERIGRLFTKFSQVDASTTRRFGGTGLGLAISKQLVELMGGRISVHSEFRRGSHLHRAPARQHPPPRLRRRRRSQPAAPHALPRPPPTSGHSASVLSPESPAAAGTSSYASSGPLPVPLVVPPEFQSIRRAAREPARGECKVGLCLRRLKGHLHSPQAAAHPCRWWCRQSSSHPCAARQPAGVPLPPQCPLLSQVTVCAMQKQLEAWKVPHACLTCTPEEAFLKRLPAGSLPPAPAPASRPTGARHVARRAVLELLGRERVGVVVLLKRSQTHFPLLPFPLLDTSHLPSAPVPPGAPQGTAGGDGIGHAEHPPAARACSCRRGGAGSSRGPAAEEHGAEAEVARILLAEDNLVGGTQGV
ncbi:unnamed protein product [Closterium sp. Naga37s-1]|nr:unnamed protein product [Closterium sp. Naga37s-1]